MRIDTFSPRMRFMLTLPEDEMKRDDDMVRALLDEIEADLEPLYDYPLVMGMSPANRVKYFHLQLLVDAGYLEEQHDGMFRMTNSGHDFMAAIRDDTIWNEVKRRASQVPGAGINLIGEIAFAYVREKARELGVLM